ncbi:MAG: type II secretion system protein GspG [Planctomycetota bacterium]|jgi:general secretion pathway protein G
MRDGREPGFTLVELMVVIVLLGLLAGVVGTQVIPLLGKGRKATAQTQITEFESALEYFYIEHKRYPESLENLTKPAPDWPRGYLKASAIPLDPWDQEYVYDPGGGVDNVYVIASMGPDMTAGTEDDITSEAPRE